MAKTRKRRRGAPGLPAASRVVMRHDEPDPGPKPTGYLPAVDPVTGAAAPMAVWLPDGITADALGVTLMEDETEGWAA